MLKLTPAQLCLLMGSPGSALPALADRPAAQLAALPGVRPGQVYPRTMGLHTADPVGRRRYAAAVLVSVSVLVLLFVGAFALHALSQH